MLGDVNLAQQEIDSRPNSRPGSRPGSRSVSRTSSTHRQYSPVNDPSCLTVPLGGRSSPVFGTGSSSPRRNFAGAAAERRSRAKLSTSDFDMVGNGGDCPRGGSCPRTRMSATADLHAWGSEFESGRETTVGKGPSSMESSYASPKRRRWLSGGGGKASSLNDIYEVLPTAQSVDKLESEM